MNKNTKNMASLIMAAVVGAVITLAGVRLFTSSAGEGDATAKKEKEPLYWVAPMDANYTADKPGKSPMGMDLIPVYADGGSDSDSGPGTIKISPEVVNNLGVRTAKAEYRQLHSQISTVGYVKYDEEQLVHIHPRVKGWVEKLYIKAAGDPVEKNQLLYAIYSPALVNAQEELVLALDRNNKRLVDAAKDRLKSLQIPPAAIKNLIKTRKVEQRISFYAPQSGVVDSMNIREGFFVTPSTTIMSIGKLDQIWVEAEVFARQASLVKVGNPVTMSLEYAPGREWHGKIDYIYPILNAQTRTIKVRLRFENEDNVLLPNMFAQVIIQTQSDDALLMIPKEGVIRTGTGDRVVLALGEGRFKSIEVKVGRIDNNFIEILDGLDVGDSIVSSAQFLLDSESSKTSDFKRMNYDAEPADQTSSVWVSALVNSVMEKHRMLNVTHQAISEWDWPSMTMDFIVSEQVGLDAFEEGSELLIELEKDETDRVKIIAYRSSDAMSEVDGSANAVSANSVSVKGVINSLMVGHRMINISRGAIEEWDRPPATVDFIAAENLSLSSLKEGMEIQFTFHVSNGNFVITDIVTDNKAPVDQSK